MAKTLGLVDIESAHGCSEGAAVETSCPRENLKLPELVDAWFPNVS